MLLLLDRGLVRHKALKSLLQVINVVLQLRDFLLACLRDSIRKDRFMKQDKEQEQIGWFEEHLCEALFWTLVVFLDCFSFVTGSLPTVHKIRLREVTSYIT